MKFHELKPFILEAVYALFLYIACPLFMLLNGWIEIQIADFVGFILIIIWSACFLKAIAFEIVPGLYAFLDLTLNSFRKERMVYLDGYADRRRLFALHGKRKRQKDCQKKYGNTTPYEYAFFDFIFAVTQGKKLLYATHFASLTVGGSYIIQYGKLSKTIISITDEQGNELYSRR